jgi:ribosome-binding ATPase YchF (GTP1/OBG family)
MNAGPGLSKKAPVLQPQDDLIELGSEQAVKAKGKLQLQGRDYIIEDGDICHFLFNV